MVTVLCIAASIIVRPHKVQEISSHIKEIVARVRLNCFNRRLMLNSLPEEDLIEDALARSPASELKDMKLVGSSKHM
jgi:3'-phosphoadenosine 5'-phosphosulfate sulfotransferase